MGQPTVGAAVDLLAGLDDRVTYAVTRVPDTERALLELRVSWPALVDREARVADRLRVFLLTWDPFAWMSDRGTAWATATGDGDSYEVVLYVMLEEALRDARRTGRTLATGLGRLAGEVVAAGSAHEESLVSGAYAQLDFRGQLPGLLDGVEPGRSASAPPGEPPGEPPPDFELAVDWGPIGLGAIQDLAQEQFGPVAIDRSPVRLETARELTPGCPACDGQQFDFPADLDDHRGAMCAEHAELAQEIIDDRLAQAQVSNHDGWDAIVGASSLLSEPTFGLPLWLLADLVRVADRDHDGRLSTDELRADAELALELACRVPAEPGEPDVLAELVYRELISDTWLIELTMALGAGGLVDEAVAVGDALAGIDAENAALYANDVAVILAEAGRAGEALARVDQNLRRFPDDLWTQFHAGDVHFALDDPAAAEQAFGGALASARARGEASGIADAAERLSRLLTDQPGREREASAVAAEAIRATRAAQTGARLATKVGRNDPCPCGSGQKYKRCCGT